MLIQLLRLNKAPKTTHAPARGQSTGQQQMKNTGNTGGKLKTSLVAGGTLLETLNTTAKTVANIQSLNKTFQDITGNKGKPTEGHASALAVERPDDRAGIAEQEPGNNSLDVEDHEYADGELEGDDNNDQELYCGQGDEEIAEGVGVDYEGDQEAYYPSKGEYDVGDQGAYPDYEDQGQEYEYDGGNQEVYYPSEGVYNVGDQEAYPDYEDQGQEYEYDGGIQDAFDPEDGGIQDAFDPQDGGILDAYCPQDCDNSGILTDLVDGDNCGILTDLVDGDNGGILTDLVDGDNGGILTDLVDALFNWSN